MTELVEFLHARIATEYRVIVDADSSGNFRAAWTMLRFPNGRVRYSTIVSDHGDGDWTVDGHEYVDTHGDELAEPFFDAARALRDIEAKRQIINYVQSVQRYAADGDPAAFDPEDAAALTHILKLLALPYADHPNYREEWRP